MKVKVRRFSREEDAKYVRFLRVTQQISRPGETRVVLAKIVRGEVIFSAPIVCRVPILIQKGWRRVVPTQRHRRLRHKLRVIK